MADYTVYIDEAGDMGFQRGTRWFVLSAVIVDKAKEPEIRALLKKLRTTINVNEIHLRTIRDFKKRAYIAREINTADFTYINALVDTSVYDATRVGGSLIAYNFICKQLLIGVSKYLSKTGKTADIVLSARGTSRDQDLIDYINDKLLPYKGNGIKSECFEKISAKQANDWDMLQVADICATTTFLAYEQTEFGFCMPCFALAIRDHLANKDGQIFVHPTKEPDKKQRVCLRICRM